MINHHETPMRSPKLTLGGPLAWVSHRAGQMEYICSGCSSRTAEETTA